ncbi:YgjP-like metallopeptidase domain-containing protein [Nevskia sp.]|uniref:YgjP-like metallopeptidase domain-containing protein n=1 Tax=Nevskia sp. TaxID=1929292 RepID=UPI0025CF228B|nr:M48 family metallopeptidase [Nevskia sp.]
MSDALPYLAGYPVATLDQVRRLIAENRLHAYLAKKYPQRHAVQSDSALLDYIGELKREHLRSAAPLHRVRYENGMDAIKNALGLHLRSSRVQGAKLKSKQEIRIASVFREGAPEFLEMIAVHELAHIREADHDKRFYDLCEHMLPDYHQREFDTRLWLMARRLEAKSAAPE